MERRKKIVELVRVSNKIKVVKRDTRRKADRIPIDTVVEAETANGISIVSTNDISNEEISLDSRVPNEVGTELLMSFQIPTSNVGLITVAGKVTNQSLSEDGKSVKLGVKFIAGDDKAKNELTKYAESNVINKWFIS